VSPHEGRDSGVRARAECSSSSAADRRTHPGPADVLNQFHRTPRRVQACEDAVFGFAKSRKSQSGRRCRQRDDARARDRGNGATFVE
jgi:hypothetical protein